MKLCEIFDNPRQLDARLQQANSIGFDTNTIWYHGTNSEFDAFEVGRKGRNSNVFGSWDTQRAAIFFAKSKKLAQEFADQGGNRGTVMAVYIRTSKVLDVSDHGFSVLPDSFYDKHGLNSRYYNGLSTWETWDAFDYENGGQDFVKALKSEGYDSVLIMDASRGGVEDATAIAIFDPKNIRKVNAAFNSDKTESSNLMDSIITPI